MTIRRPACTEYPAIRDLIRSVVTEIYGDLWDTAAMPHGDEDWSTGWIAVDGTDVIGVLLTTSDRIDDLWIMRFQRGHGLGAELLSVGETEIAKRGLPIARLRVVKGNSRATSFYLHHGWQMEKEFQHEHLPVTMLQLEKALAYDF
jgi:GNAT superfamily N-acetyltransferase